ncbi:GtrA family protein [Metabacillus herbersteinensis]|uniref:GtrA family protein n=2 Tax=Metabacillus herbersteinensis TaxID=283816 RepID=A0ABV6GCJ2_9BACI
MFLVVGIVNTLIGLFTVFLLMNVFGCSYWISTLVGIVVGGLVSFFLNRLVTFHSKAAIHKVFFSFILLICFCYICSFSSGELIASLIYSHIYYIGLDEKNLAVIVGSGIYTILNYLGQKYIIFPR